MSLPPNEDHIQDPEDREKIEGAAPLKRQRSSLSISPVPGNAVTPQRIPELKPIGLIDNEGNLAGLQFVNKPGEPHTNVIASSSICAGAYIYKGPSQNALNYINAHQGSYYVLRLKRWQLPPPRGWRMVWMNLRFLGPVNGNAKAFPELAGDPGDVVVILIPQGALVFPNEHPSDFPLIYSLRPSPRPRLVLEFMLTGRHFSEATEICQFYLE